METRTLTQAELADLITWGMCEMANGAGKGKCNPEHCVCGAEGRVVAAYIFQHTTPPYYDRDGYCDNPARGY